MDVARRGGGNPARANGIVIAESAPTVAIEIAGILERLPLFGTTR